MTIRNPPAAIRRPQANLCRERLSDDELAACCPFGGDWDNCYIGVLAAIAAMRQ
jgi:hypothetical protein